MRFFAVIITLISINAQALGRKSIPKAPSYVVISDMYDAKIPSGQCVVSGNIKPQYSQIDYDYDGKIDPVPSFRISTLDGKRQTYTDSLGNYKLTLAEGDTSIYVFAKYHREIVIWSYQFKSQHHVIINFMPSSALAVVEVAKPILYLYSEKEMNVNVNFEAKSDIVFTHPSYANGWNFSLKENKLTDTTTHRTYPYLFWDGKTDELGFHFQDGILQGAVIRTDTVISFLENTLTAMGMNATEQTDFITFWGPRMISQEYVLVQFLNNKLYDQKISTLSVTPTPDNLLRTFMLFCPLETDQLPIRLLPQQFESVSRTGFTLVEWGGSELPSLYTNP